MASICIEVRAGTVRALYTRGISARNVRIQIRDYDVECIGDFGEPMWVDEYGDFLIMDDWGSSDLDDSRSPRIRRATDADYESDGRDRASRGFTHE